MAILLTDTAVRPILAQSGKSSKGVSSVLWNRKTRAVRLWSGPVKKKREAAVQRR